MEDKYTAARRLVSALDATEMQIVVGLVSGMSTRDIAAATGLEIDKIERSRISMMRKLGASSVADAVRIGLHARLDPQS